tara:strand:+ start:4866 stop:6056 length:1191 start_codon:yes stop_codon:yes gene_type:complete
MKQEQLIAEICEDKIRYVICEKNEQSDYKILKKKISENNGIKKGKILDFKITTNRISQDLKDLEKESGKIFRNISVIINEPEICCTNISGFKKLNGSKVEKRDLDYILNEAKSSIIKNQEKNSILHILNSNFILDKIKKNKVPVDLHGDHLSLHMTFISLPTNSLKNISALFTNSDLKIDRVISKPLACGMDLLGKNKEARNFALINFDKEVSSISLYEDSSLVFLKIFPFGTNSIYRDLIQLCSLKESEIRKIMKELDFINIEKNKDKYIEKNLFTESEFKKLSKNHLNDIVKARTKEMLDYIFNKNKNLKYINNKILRVDLFFEDEDILENLGNLFKEYLKIDKNKTQIELLPLNDFSALSGAAELIFKGWDKEAIPLTHKKKSVIASFFERFF